MLWYYKNCNFTGSIIGVSQAIPLVVNLEQNKHSYELGIADNVFKNTLMSTFLFTGLFIISYRYLEIIKRKIFFLKV